MKSASILSIHTNPYTYRQSYNYSNVSNSDASVTGNNVCNYNSMLLCNVSDRMLVKKSNISLKGGLNLKGYEKVFENYSKKSTEFTIDPSDIKRFAEKLYSDRLTYINKHSKKQILSIIEIAESICSKRVNSAGQKLTGPYKIEMSDIKSSLNLFNSQRNLKCVDVMPDVNDYKSILKTYLARNKQIILNEYLINEFAEVAQIYGLSKKDMISVLNKMKPRAKRKTFQVQSEYLHTALNELITSNNPERFETYKLPCSTESYEETIRKYLKENPNADIDEKVIGKMIDALLSYNIPKEKVPLILDIIEADKTNGLGYQTYGTKIKIEHEDFSHAVDCMARSLNKEKFKKNLFKKIFN